MNKNTFKSFFSVVLLSVCLVIFSFFSLYPLKDTFRSVIASCYTNDTTRVDIFNYGNKENNTVKILSDTDSNEPNWCKNKKGKCIATINKISSSWQNYIIKFQVIGDGDISISLKGSDQYADYPIVVDYKDFIINGKKIFDEPSQHWSKHAYKHTFAAKDGDIVEFSFKSKKTDFKDSIWKNFLDFNIYLFFTFFIFCLFLFIFCLFLFYKIIRYSFKNNIFEKGSYPDIIFLTLFFLLLFVPMSHISTEDKSEQENRLLAKYPQTFIKGNINLLYSQQFENWFNDRFFGRVFALSLYKNIMFKTNKYYRLNGFGLYKDNWAFNHSQLSSGISNEKLQKIREGIAEYQKFCNTNNLKCYIEIAPRKLEFAKDKQLRIIPKYEKDKAEIIKDYVFDKTGFDIIYPLKAMKKADNNDLVYFKTDHHWSDYGAFIGYQELMKAIKKDFSNLITLTEDDFDIFYSNKVRAEVDHEFLVGYTCKMLLLSDKECPKDVDYRYYTHKKEKELRIKEYDQKDKDFYAPYAPNKQKVMLLGNSFEENISYFLAPTFQNVFKRRSLGKHGDNLNLSRWKDEILKQNVDIVIFVIHSENSERLQDLKD